MESGISESRQVILAYDSLREGSDKIPMQLRLNKFKLFVPERLTEVSRYF
jgi:hypothetical protein